MDSTPHHDYMAEITDLAKENKKLKQQLADDEDGCVEDCVIVHSLQNRLNDWIYELAYYTEDEVATPKGVKKFVGKALEDKTKEIDDLREQLHNKMFKREELDMEDKTDIFGEFGIWVWGKTIPSDVDKCQEFMRMSPLGKYIEQLENRIHLLYNEAKQAQPNALKASEVKPKPLSEQRIEEIVIAGALKLNLEKEENQILVFKCCGKKGKAIETRGQCPYCNAQNIELVNLWKFDLIKTIYNAQSEEKYCTCKKPKITLGQHTLRDYCDKCNKPIIQNEEDNK